MPLRNGFRDRLEDFTDTAQRSTTQRWDISSALAWNRGSSANFLLGGSAWCKRWHLSRSKSIIEAWRLLHGLFRTSLGPLYWDASGANLRRCILSGLSIYEAVSLFEVMVLVIIRSSLTLMTSCSGFFHWQIWSCANLTCIYKTQIIPVAKDWTSGRTVCIMFACSLDSRAIFSLVQVKQDWTCLIESGVAVWTNAGTIFSCLDFLR